MRDEPVKDAAQDVAEGAAEGVPKDMVKELAFRARAPRTFLTSPVATTTAAAVFVGTQLGSSAAFGSGCGQALPGVPRKAPLCLSPSSLSTSERNCGPCGAAALRGGIR